MIEPVAFDTPWLRARVEGPWRHAYSWLGVLQTRLFGRPGLFRPRLPELMFENVTSVYDLAPLRAKLEDFVDFERLNDGEVRVSVITTDIETGQETVFDTHKGDRIGPDHLLASCGFLPDFAPLQIDGRLLGDGAFVANAPVGTVLQDPEPEGELLCFVVDLFSPDGERPSTLEEAAARRWDLILGNQSREKLNSLEREYRLRSALGRLISHLGPDALKDPELASVLSEATGSCVTLLHLSYHAPLHEAGPEKAFDFSRTTLEDRWEAGFLDMAEAVGVATDPAGRRSGFSIHRIRRKAHGR